MFDFFLSHNRAEKDWTRLLAKSLRDRGAKVFFDEDSIKIGDDVVSVISSSLQTSKHVVLVMSPRSVLSRWVELEWASTLYSDPAAAARRIFPILIEQCDVPFVLKRLHYLKACGKSVEQCADELIASAALDEGETVSRVAPKIPLHTAVRPFEHYLERKTDQLATRAIAAGRGAFVFGPRRIGKTSLLRRQAYRAELEGIPTVWVDLSGLRTRGVDLESAFYREVIYRLQPRLPPPDNNENVGRLRHRALDYLGEVASVSGTNQVLLLLDELDAAWNTPNPEPFAHSLRELMSNPHSSHLRCAVAGYNPPWSWLETSPVSPWWNNFSILPMTYFAKAQVVRFLSAVGLDDETARAIYGLTGGNPAQTMEVANAIQEGENVEEILARPLKLAGPLASFIEWTYESTRAFFDSRPNLASALLRGESIPDRHDRLTLWLRGFTRDADSDPPEMLGTQMYEILRRLGR